MKFSFQVRYELDAPLALAVAAYLDCEHYVYLHSSLTNHIEIGAHGPDFYKCHQTWKVLGLRFGQSYTCRYQAPATFINEDVRPYPVWLPSVHHLVRTRTVLRYFENPESKTTLSELTVEMEVPFWMAPLKGWIRRVVERMKILKDLEDQAMFDRRARLYGRNYNDPYLKKHQFLLHKDDYERYFGPGSAFLGDPATVERRERWTNIKELDRPYVRKFLEKSYIKYTNFQPT